jgi:hypothetical protein
LVPLAYSAVFTLLALQGRPVSPLSMAIQAGFQFVGYAVLVYVISWIVRGISGR